MITIKPTRAGKEYLNDKSGMLEKILLSKIGGKDKSIMERAVSLLRKTELKEGVVQSDKPEELNFLIIHRLATTIELTSAVHINHLSNIHVKKEEEIEKLNAEPPQNSLASIHALSDDILGEVPDVLPTHIGGIKLEEYDYRNPYQDEIDKVIKKKERKTKNK